MSNKKEGYRRLSVIFTWIFSVISVTWYAGFIAYIVFEEGFLRHGFENGYDVAILLIPVAIILIVSALPKVIYQMWLYAHEGFNKEVSQ